MECNFQVEPVEGLKLQVDGFFLLTSLIFTYVACTYIACSLQCMLVYGGDSPERASMISRVADRIYIS